ncbi:MAG: L-histidine N(alpha)-methyltransferase [Limisphaerales bacterium]
MISSTTDVIGTISEASRLREEFVSGLRRYPKMVPCKFFYDKRGSLLFDQICGLEEYYITRAEAGILTENIDEIVALCGPECLLVEFGSGNSSKTRLLLNHLRRPVAYVPIDISRPHLLNAAAVLELDYFPLEILPVCADYNQPLTIPSPSNRPLRTTFFFPGSTIGNFTPSEAKQFLERIGSLCQPGDGLLIGIDLVKDKRILEAAYDDASGVTAAFNLNILRRANREMAADFQLSRFQHRAIFNEEESRIEMHLVSTLDQKVQIGNDLIEFMEGESIITEFSYKYRIEAFHDLAAAAGWKNIEIWTDRKRWFSVQYLSYHAST